MIGEVLELGELLRNRWRSADELEAIRTRKLRATICHAVQNVPYYRSLFRSAGLSPEDIRTAEDLRHVPVTTKDDLRAAGLGRIVAEGVDRRTCHQANTSGSTGKPFTTFQTERDRRIRRLNDFRALLLAQLRPWDRLAVLGPAGLSRTRLHQRLGLFRSVNISGTLSVEEQVRRIRHMNPTVLFAFPTVLRALLHSFGYRMSAVARPRTLITCAETLDEKLRDKLLSDVDAETYNFYGTVETGMIATDCPAHEGLHIHADHVILECLDQGETAAAGAAGMAVATTLNNHAMPFIRYRIGDICAYVERPCSCGSHFPLISPPLGRQEDLIRRPHGKVVAPCGVTETLRNVPGLLQHRLIQKATDRFVLQLVMERPLQPEKQRQLHRWIAEYLGPPVSLEFELVDLIQDERRKFRALVPLTEST